MVTIRGSVAEHTKEGADEHIDKLAKKYLGVDKRIILKIKPERVHYQPPQN